MRATRNPRSGNNGWVIYTWTCADCPGWAEEYWPTQQEANSAADSSVTEHLKVCPGNARLAVVGRPPHSHPEQLGVERLMGAYDPNEPMLVPAWAVLAARSALGFLSRQVSAGATTDFSNDDEIWLWATNVTAANPLPDRALPDTRAELSQLLRDASNTLAASLPKPF